MSGWDLSSSVLPGAVVALGASAASLQDANDTAAPALVNDLDGSLGMQSGQVRVAVVHLHGNLIWPSANCLFL